jgi:hypothetical protein
MPLDPTGWFVGDAGAEHSAEVARVLAYAATAGADGVIGPTDCKVSPLAVPGAAVRIGPGAWVGTNRAATGRAQSFVSRVISDEPVPIAATGSGAGRTDLICLVERDPSVPGSGGTVGGPYHQVLVVSGVPATATRLQDQPGHEFTTGIALARVTLPAATGTVTAGMITDLRQVANPRRVRTMNHQQIAANVDVKNSTYIDWPMPMWDVDVPVWAMQIVLKIDTLAFREIGNTQGEFAVYLGAPGETGETLLKTFSYDVNGSYSEIVPVQLGVEAAVPAALRGKRTKVRMRARRSTAWQAGQGYIRSIVNAHNILDVEFKETAV